MLVRGGTPHPIPKLLAKFGLSGFLGICGQSGIWSSLILGLSGCSRQLQNWNLFLVRWTLFKSASLILYGILPLLAIATF
jgi:hypothetical protein